MKRIKTFWDAFGAVPSTYDAIQHRKSQENRGGNQAIANSTKRGFVGQTEQARPNNEPETINGSSNERETKN